MIEEVKTIKTIEEILESEKVLSLWKVIELDLEGKKCYERNDNYGALMKKVEAGRGFEIWGRFYLAGFSFDNASLYAYYLGMHRTRLLLNERALYNHQIINDLGNIPYTLVRVADCHLQLGDRVNFMKFLKEGDDAFRRNDLDPTNFKLYRILLKEAMGRTG